MATISNIVARQGFNQTSTVQERFFLGPSLIGMGLGYLFLGTLFVQVYFYYLHFKKDNWWLKGMVVAVVIMEIVQTAWTTEYVFETLVINWGNPLIIQKPPISIESLPVMDGIIGSFVQMFYCYRIWVFGRAWWAKLICVLLVCLALMELVTPIVTLAIFNPKIGTVVLKAKTGLLLEIWLSSAFTADLLIAATMIYILQTARSHSYFRKTNDIVTKLIRQVVQTGAFTAVLAFTELVLLKTRPLSGEHLAPAYILGKMYTNSLLVNLNARAASSYESSHQTTSGAITMDSSVGRSRATNNTRVNVNTTTVTQTDYYLGEDTVKMDHDSPDVYHLRPIKNGV